MIGVGRKGWLVVYVMMLRDIVLDVVKLQHHLVKQQQGFKFNS